MTAAASSDRADIPGAGVEPPGIRFGGFRYALYRSYVLLDRRPIEPICHPTRAWASSVSDAARDFQPDAPGANRPATIASSSFISSWA